MTIDTFKEIMLNAPLEEKWEVLSQIEQTPQFFNLLVQLLKASDDRIQFMALFTLIKRFSHELSNPDDELVEQILILLGHRNLPIIDRAMWALSIMGIKGLARLLKIAQSDDLKWKKLAILAIGRNANLHLEKEEVVNILLKALYDNSDEIKFTALCSLMNIRPSNFNHCYVIRDFDFIQIYAAVKPIIAYFIKSDNENFSEWAIRYMEEIIQWEKSSFTQS